MLETLLTTDQLPIWAEEFSKAVSSAYSPDCVILFGSVARREQKLDSDIDIIVIGGNLPENRSERFRLLMRLRPRLAPIQVQSFTLDEWKLMMDEKHLTVLEALSDGKALHGVDLFRQCQEQFKNWQHRGLRRTDCAWTIPAG